MLLAASAATPIPTRIPLIVRIAVHKLCSSANTTDAPDTAPNPFVLCKQPPEHASAQLDPTTGPKFKRLSDLATLRTARGSNRLAHRTRRSQSCTAAYGAPGPIDNVMTIVPARLRREVINSSCPAVFAVTFLRWDTPRLRTTHSAGWRSCHPARP